MLNELVLALTLLAPSPAAGTPATLAFTGADGTLYTLTVIVTDLKITPPPPPPPVGPKLVVTENPLLFGSVPAGTPPFLRQVSVRNEGGAVLTVAAAPIAGASAGEFAFTRGGTQTLVLPPGDEKTYEFRWTPGSTGAKQAYVILQTNATPANYRLDLTAEVTAPMAREPQVRGYTDATGQAVEAARWGSEVTVTGAGFGAAPGTLYLGGDPQPVLAWSDAAIRFRVAGGVSTARAVTVGVRTAAGEWLTTLGFWVLP